MQNLSNVDAEYDIKKNIWQWRGQVIDIQSWKAQIVKIWQYYTWGDMHVQNEISRCSILQPNMWNWISQLFVSIMRCFAGKFETCFRDKFLSKVQSVKQFFTVILLDEILRVKFKLLTESYYQNNHAK